jgi:hypothetical protein
VETRTVLATLAAGALGAGVATTMLLAGTGGLTFLVTLLLAGAEAALLFVVRDGAVRTRQFVLAWSGQAGLTYAVTGDPTLASALVYLGVGVVFAAVVVAVLALTGGRQETAWLDEEPRADTAPLPVVEGE